MDKLYVKPVGRSTRWSSFENTTAAKGRAALENHGAKGHAFDTLCAGQTQTLLDYKGAGIINRFWFTMDKIHVPYVLRSLVLRCYWDNCSKPAVEAPLGDFVGVGSRLVPYESHLFSSPEGRSINIYIPMPFKTAARVTLTNESSVSLVHLFYDINLTALVEPEPDQLYFHSWWHRENPTKCGVDFEILPLVKGKGRFLGTSMVVNPNRSHGMWWGEGVFKAYIDGDTTHPTLCGTGCEDYVGTGWGLGKFTNLYQGCTFADGDLLSWAFYRFHIVDPIYFDVDLRVTMQQLGGGMGDEVRREMAKGLPIKPVSYDNSMVPGDFKGLLGSGYNWDDSTYDKTWVNFFREDDVCGTAYFYIDSSENALPPLQKHEERVTGFDN